MARPYKTGLDYFPHDVDAVNDEKIEAIIAEHGATGYAVYFMLLERIYKRGDLAELDLACGAIRKSLARKLSIELDLLDAIVNTACAVALFDKKTFEARQVITSQGVQKRVAAVNQMRASWREKKSRQHVEVCSGENEVDNLRKTPQIKEKRKVKEKNLLYTPKFDEFYEQYPRKAGKAEAFMNYESVLKECSDEKLLLSATNYANECKRLGTEEKFIKHAKTFLGPAKAYLDYCELKTIAEDQCHWRG